MTRQAKITFIGDVLPKKHGLYQTTVDTHSGGLQDVNPTAINIWAIEHLSHASMMNPYTAAELDRDQLWNLADVLLAARGERVAGWARPSKTKKAA